jgi:5-hydroxyisourate hydrolase
VSAITTHVLDTSRGVPAAGVGVVLEMLERGGAWKQLGAARTDGDGRVRAGLAADATAGTYRLRFDTGAYFASQKAATFLPEVVVVFAVLDAAQHHHVPLLLSPFGYSTYRGS